MKLGIKRLLLWFKIRWELHRILMSDPEARAFMLCKKEYPKFVKTLEVIASRTCTGSNANDCIISRPDQIGKWCSRCLALDVLIHD
jgi:hypothetical protein